MSWTDLPPMNTLVPFETTMRLGSLTKAAAELHVTHGAVSRQLKSLEHALGVELFRRDGRVLVPTPAAVELNRQVVDALGRLAAAARQARSSTQPHPLVLSCEPTLMMRWLLPRLGSLTGANPGLDVHLSAAGGAIDLRRAGVDVAIRRNDFDLDPGVEALPLFHEWIGPVCTPELAAKIGEAADLAALPRLVSATRPVAWDTWARLAGVAVPPAPVQTFEHFYLSLEAASAGLGVAIGPYPLVANDLDSGRLVAPLGFVEDGTQYVLLTRSGATDPRVGMVYRWLRENASATLPGPHERAGKSA
ncbi:LysR family transcriptional regulator [Amycolatopsis granulosa]|uniref:LysR family transcriptional regulator n=1 Tax=Amycolatopsis granulosa TaxID=185684 RepID=UPI0014217215|nr:LysR family transcriptional regulator [Amycolatopsis granulosa]NIH86017.1 DNA-binding transcriptional LysR family regulator [Amycolatopsis granulosa]